MMMLMPVLLHADDAAADVGFVVAAAVVDADAAVAGDVAAVAVAAVIAVVRITAVVVAVAVTAVVDVELADADADVVKRAVYCHHMFAGIWVHYVAVVAAAAVYVKVCCVCQ
jgi:hypothetical protein